MKSSPFFTVALLSAIAVVLMALIPCQAATRFRPTPIKPQTPLVAKHYYSGFADAHDTYNAISAAGDGKIYYVLSSDKHDVGGQFYVYDPKTDQTKFIADLSEAVGEKKCIAQGKSHVEFLEHNGKLYFATHVGFYEMIDGAECLPVNAPAGYKLYQGGHFVSYDMKTGKVESLALAPHGEGILTMTMDKQRGHLYGITWPKGYLLHYDLNTKQLKDLGLVNAQGEGGVIGKDYRVICRSMVVDPRDGNVYYSTAEGDIFFYRPGLAAPEKLVDVDLRIDYFGSYDVTGAGSMGYNWRKIFWYEPENVAYGVHGNSGYLFRFDPKAKKIEIVERITSEPSRKNGMFDLFSYGYLGYMLGKDNTIFYLTGGPIYKDGKRVKGVDKIAMGAARGLENLHLVTFHIPTRKYKDYGPVFYESGDLPTYVNSIAQDKAGNIYTLARFMHDGREIEDLVKIPLEQSLPGWKLVWEENFDKDGKIDETVWSKIPRGSSDWNRHMSDHDALYDVKDGNLILRGMVNPGLPGDSAPFITGGIYTKDKKGFYGGKIEISAKLGNARGAWPAFWLLPFDNTGWPAGGEIDIMERLNSDAIAYQTVHSHYTVKLKQTEPKKGATGPIRKDEYNVYAVELYPNNLVLSINGEKTLSYPRIETDLEGQFPFDRPFYLLLDMQLGGQWVGEVNPKDLPVEMAIDWVRFYEWEQ